MNIFKLIKLFQKANGRSPSPNELAKLKQQAEIMSAQENVIPFPGGGKDKINPFDDFKASEDAFEESLNPKRIKGGISTKIKLNSFRENEQYAKDLIGGKSAEFNTLKSEDRKEVLDLLEAQIKKDTNPIGPPIDPDDMPFADGGRIGFAAGGIDKVRRLILKLMGSGGAAAVAGKAGILGLKGKKTAKAVEDIQITMGNDFDGEYIDEIREGTTTAFQYLEPLTPKGKKILDNLVKEKKIGKDFDIPDAEDAAIIVDDLVNKKNIKLQIGDDLPNYKTGKQKVFTSDTADQIIKQGEDSSLILDPTYAPKVYHNEYQQEIVEMIAPKIVRDRNIKKVKDSVDQRLEKMYDARNRKQSGGLAGLLGEEPRSEYGAGGGTGAPPITYDDNVDNIGPGSSNRGKLPRLNVMPEDYYSEGTGTGVMIDPRGFKDGKLQIPTQGLANGGRIGFKDGGMDRRGFLKLMGGLASIPVLGKFFKAAKVAKVAKIVPLKGTTTTMPAWFPDLVDKFVAKGIGKKIDADMIEYKTKDLPGITMTKHDDGRIIVEGQNEYSRAYGIEYEPPGVELLDETTGKSVRTKGDFRATDLVPEAGGRPDDVPDFFPEQLDSVDDILGSDARTMEEFATGSEIKNPKRGEQVVGQAEVRAESAADDAAEKIAEEADEFASGGIAGMLGFQDGGRIGFDNGNIVRNLTKAGKFTGYGLAGEAAFAAPFALAEYAAGESGDRILGEATFGLFGETEQEEIRKATGDLGYATQIIDDLKSRLPMLKKQLESFNDKNDPTGAQRNKFAKIYNKLGDQFKQEVNKFRDDEGQFNKNLYNQALNNYTAGLNQIGKFKDQLAKERPDERTGLESYDVALAGGGLSRLLGE